MSSKTWFWLIMAVLFIGTLSPVMDLLPTGTDTADLIGISVLIIWVSGAIISMVMGAASLRRN